MMQENQIDGFEGQITIIICPNGYILIHINDELIDWLLYVF